VILIVFASDIYTGITEIDSATYLMARDDRDFDIFDPCALDLKSAQVG
jgi:hypothetical protein